IRIMGVLQRIAVCYLAAGWLYLLVYRPGANPSGEYEPIENNLSRKTAAHAAIATIAVVLLVGYWALMMFFPVPGSGAGHMTPNDNLGAYIDRALLNGHL